MKKLAVMATTLFSVVLFAAAAFGAGFGGATNYSADMETTTQQGAFTSKMFFKDTKMRMESEQRGHKSVTIIRPDKKVMWMMMGGKDYMEMPLDLSKQDIQSKLHDPNVKVDKQFIANEAVDRHPAKKYHITVTTNGKAEKSGYIWEASDLSNFPVKYESEDGRRIATIRGRFFFVVGRVGGSGPVGHPFGIEQPVEFFPGYIGQLPCNLPYGPALRVCLLDDFGSPVVSDYRVEGSGQNRVSAGAFPDAVSVHRES